MMSIIDEAKASNRIIWHSSMAAGFMEWTPEELEEEQSQNRFRWSDENFHLITRDEYAKSLWDKAARLADERQDVLKRREVILGNKPE